MSENNQIQEISSLIEETKVLLFNEILKSILKSKNAPFDVFWNEEKNRFEIVNHMKDSIKFSLFNKEYVVGKKDVCKINIDWNTIKDLIERPFVSQHISFKNKKDQNLGKEYIDEIINTRFISKESFLLGHGDENQFNVSIVYNDDTGNLEVKAVDTYFDGVVPIDLDLTFNYSNSDFSDYPEVLNNDFFSYFNMTKNLKFIDIEGGLFKLKVSDPNNVFGGKEFFVKAYQESKISKMTKQQDGTYLSEEIFNSNRSRNVGAFYFAPTNLHFSLDLFMSAYGNPQ